MAKSIVMIVGDTRPDLVATLSDENGPKDLTGCSVRVLVRHSFSQTEQDLPATIDNPPTLGMVRHVWQPGETDVQGTYIVQYVVTFPDNGVQTFPNNGSVSLILRPREA